MACPSPDPAFQPFTTARSDGIRKAMDGLAVSRGWPTVFSLGDLKGYVG